MGTTRRWLVILAGTLGLSLALAPTAGAVADQQLDPEYKDCTPPVYPAGCAQNIRTEGSGFPANTTISFSWLEPDAFLLGAGGPGAPVQETTGAVCSNTFLTSLRSDWATPLTATNNRDPLVAVTTDSNGTFDATVNGPPDDAVYGPNAICAYWEHSPGVYRGVGNQYTIYPA